MASAWFYMMEREPTGPVSSSELRSLVKSGTVTPETQIAKSPNGPWVPAGKVGGLFTEKNHPQRVWRPTKSEKGAPGKRTSKLPPATKVAMLVGGAVSAAALGYLVWFVAIRDRWEEQNFVRVTKTLEDAEHLRQSDPFKAYKVYADVLNEAHKHPIKSETLRDTLVEAERVRTELFKKVEPQIKAEEAEKARQAQQAAERAEEQRVAAEARKAEEQERRELADKHNREVAARKERALAYRHTPESARKALNVLKKVDARMDVGINYVSYGAVIGEAWGEVKIFVESEEGKKLEEFCNMLRAAVADYKLAHDIWADKIKYPRVFGDSADVDALMQKCWTKARRCLETAEAMLMADKAEEALEAAAAAMSNESDLELEWTKLAKKITGG
jgi:hypothetical protein